MTEFVALLTKYAAMAIEICGILVIIMTVAKEMYTIIFRNRFKLINNVRDTTMNQGLASALEILLGAEILKTIIYRDMRQLIEVGVLMLIRIFMTVLIHWELEHKLKVKKEDPEANEK